MREELEKKLVSKYPNLFRYYRMSPTESCMAWGCECRDGWYKLLNELFSKLSKYDDVILVQVKEKFGTLRVYVNGASDEVFELIDEAERKSGMICEVCGEEGKLRGGSWFVTMCDTCYNNYLKRR